MTIASTRPRAPWISVDQRALVVGLEALDGHAAGAARRASSASISASVVVP
jgi:hypothetical protein